MKVIDICSYLDKYAPPAYQESYDNAGLLVGDPQMEIQGALITLDVTEEVLDEAIQQKSGLIVAHHPLIFGGLKRITGKNMIERIVIKAIQNNIAIYAAHTNLDSVWGGVNTRIADRIGLKNQEVLSPVENSLIKLVYFVPEANAQETREAIFEAGAGHIGDYDMCSYNLHGTGTFRAGEGTNPYVGEKGEMHKEAETRVETILPGYLKNKVLTALITSHPYEEVAYDIYPLANVNHRVGLGMVGELEKPMNEKKFLELLKEKFNAECLRHTDFLNRSIKRVAVCGGSGSSLIKKAMHTGADVFVTGDIKYHQFFEAENRIMLVDLGHYETEQVTKALFYELLNKKFPKFALRQTEVNTNPINYI